MTKKSILKIFISIIGILVICVITVSWNFCFMNFNTCDTKPYFIKATVIDKSPDKITFSNIRPFVVFDETDVIAKIRYVENWPPTTPPAPSDIFLAPSENFSDAQPGQEIWIKYSAANGDIESVF